MLLLTTSTIRQAEPLSVYSVYANIPPAITVNFFHRQLYTCTHQNSSFKMTCKYISIEAEQS
jgi:hypothetical protein